MAGLRVIDFTRVLSGPFSTALLADLGAEVIMVESPQGDDYRHVGPFIEGSSVLFAFANRGKKSVLLDLKEPAGLATALRLADGADIVVENFRPGPARPGPARRGVAERLGIGHQVLRGRNERLVYASISGFGQDGPRAQRPAYDLVVQAATGLMSINGAADGPPMIVGEAFGDLVAGLLCILGNPGCGGSARLQRQELPYRRCDVRHLAVHDAHGNRQLPGEWTAASPCRQSPSAVSTIRCLAAGDDSVVIAVLGNRQFEAFADVIQRPDLLHDGRFASNEGHCPHEADLRVAIEGWSRQRSVAHVVEEPGAAGIACAAIGAMAWPAGRSPGMRSLLGYLGQGRRHGRLP